MFDSLFRGKPDLLRFSFEVKFDFKKSSFDGILAKQDYAKALNRRRILFV